MPILTLKFLLLDIGTKYCDEGPPNLQQQKLYLIFSLKLIKVVFHLKKKKLSCNPFTIFLNMWLSSTCRIWGHLPFANMRSSSIDKQS